MEDTLEGQVCPMCRKKSATLMERAIEIPYFGKVFIFGIMCSSCGYRASDVECESSKGPVKFTFEVEGKDDLNVRVVRSSSGIIKIPRVGSLEPGVNAEGFVSNIEGVILRFKKQIEHLRDQAEDKSERKKAKNLLKKLDAVLRGEEKLKIVVEDPSGNSAIISEKAKRGK